MILTMIGIGIFVSIALLASLGRVYLWSSILMTASITLLPVIDVFTGIKKVDKRVRISSKNG